MDRYVPDCNRLDKPPLAPPRKRHVDTLLPKNFAQPVTCFFWHQNGLCNKRDEDCAYAHWDTGRLAAAPVHVSDCKYPTCMNACLKLNHETAAAAVAKRPVNSHAYITGRHASATTDLGEWEERLHIKEQKLKKQESDLRTREEIVMKKESRLRERGKRAARYEHVPKNRSYRDRRPGEGRDHN